MSKFREYLKQIEYFEFKISSSRDKLLNSFVRLMNKRHGLKLKESGIVFQFKSGGTEYEGIKFMNSSYSRALRVNFKSGGNEIDNIQLWFKPASKPDLVLNCSGLNINQIVQYISSILSDPTMIDESIYLEAINKNEIKEALEEYFKEKKIKVNSDKFKTAEILRGYTEWQKANSHRPELQFHHVNVAVKNYKAGVYKIGEEIESISKRVKKGTQVVASQEQTDEQRNAWEKLKKLGISGKLGGAETFEKIKEYLTKMIDGKTKKNLFIIAGDPGLGKTEEPTIMLNKKVGPRGQEWTEVGAASTPKALYEILYKWNGKFILLNDVDNIWSDSKSINIIKHATESNPNNRYVQWNSTKMKDADDEDFDPNSDVPREFLFTGKIIVNTNKYFRELPGSILSRGLKQEVDFTPQQSLERIESLLDVIEPDVPMKIKKMCLEDLKEYKAIFQKLDFRKFYAALENYTIEGISREKALKWSIADLTGDAGAAGKRS